MTMAFIIKLYYTTLTTVVYWSTADVFINQAGFNVTAITASVW